MRWMRSDVVVVKCKDCRFMHSLAEENHFCKHHEEKVRLTDSCMRGKPIRPATRAHLHP